MSFSQTADEQNRVKLAEVLGYKLDPISYKDMGLVIAISVVYGLGFLAVVFMLWNRKYPPLKSKNPELMAAAYVSCVFWFVGDLQINGHVHLRGTILTDCRGIGVWMRVLLGVCTVSALIALRSYGLYRVFKQNRPYRGVAFYLPFLVYCACTLVYGIVTQVLPSSVIIEYQPMLDVCYCPSAFRGALYGYIWATWLLIAFINWNIRNIKSSFNESREMAFSCFLVFAILTFSTVMQFVRPEYPFSQVLRLLTTGMDHLGTTLVWWSIMGVPLFNCAFRRHTYLECWTAKLRKDGLQHEYNIKSDSYNATDQTRLSLESDYDDGMFLFDASDNAPVYLPNGEPRPPSRKQKRQSAQTAKTLSPTRAVNPADPFDIPRMLPSPMSPPATVAGSPIYNSDPFRRLSSNIAYVIPPAVANDSHTILPRFSPTIYHSTTSRSSISPVLTHK
ncbi:hypothetical protein IWW50_003279 [Coemansia erecta]|nr:hypothetical protein IWW50_003279 [Coemansia erecta]